MSYKEAKEDGIRIEKAGRYSVYYPHCRFCGDEVRSLNYLRDRHYVCKDCKPNKKILLSTGLFDTK